MRRANLSTPLFGHLSALFTITVWGVTFASIKLLLVDFSPVEILFYRLLLATAALYLFSAGSPPRLARQNFRLAALKGEWRVMAAGLTGVTLFFLLQNAALSLTLAANVSVLLSVAPLFTALLSRLVFGERLKASFLLGFTTAMLGILLIAFNGSVTLKLNPLGDLLALAAALSWAFYSVLLKQIAAPPGQILLLTRKIFAYGLLFLLPVLPLANFELGLERLAELPNLLNLLFLGVVASALCFLTWNTAVHLLGPVKTAVYIFVVPLVTMAASFLLLGEPVTLAAAAGVALILTGMALTERVRPADRVSR
jgi:drug/metabolite transporter (DMT)-like permease